MFFLQFICISPNIYRQNLIELNSCLLLKDKTSKRNLKSVLQYYRAFSKYYNIKQEIIYAWYWLLIIGPLYTLIVTRHYHKRVTIVYLR